MRQANDSSGRLRFAVFEVDLRAGELTKRGLRIRLQEQPFQVLAMLLGKPGELVTREELCEKIWGQTVVDFDHGLNKAINKIREALGDSAENPRFVETVARRGYRFLADVTPSSPDQAKPTRHQPRLHQVKDSRQQLPPGQIPRSPEEHDHVILRHPLIGAGSKGLGDGDSAHVISLTGTHIPLRSTEDESENQRRLPESNRCRRLCRVRWERVIFGV